MKTEYLKKIFFNRLLAGLMSVLGTVSASGAGAAGVAYRASGVATVEFRRNDAVDRTQTRVPACVICHLGQPEGLTLSFDVIGGNVESLYYDFVHCDADWQQSDLMEMEFVDGFNRIYGTEKASLSFNTTTAYVHYDVAISTAPLLASGNYIVEVRQSADDALLVREPMLMTEDACGIASRVVMGDAMQEVEVQVQWPAHGISSPETQMKVLVWQNGRIDDMRRAESPTFVRRDDITYTRCPELTFCGGTEWRWLDTRSIRLIGISDSRVEFVSNMYHYTMAQDAPPRAYTYREDFNGGSWIETRDRRYDEAQTVADYAVAHYTFAPEDPTLIQTSEVYILGDATGWEPSAANRLEPDASALSFVGQHLVKQGLHNYLFAARPRGRKKSSPAPQMTETEGCYGETENDYYIAVYVRRPGETYDHLVATKWHNTLRSRDAFIY